MLYATARTYMYFVSNFTRQLCCSYSLSLIDAMDTLVVMGNYSEFRRVVGLVLQNSDFDRDINVSVFETNIRGELLNIYS